MGHLRWVTFLTEKNGFEQHQMPPKLCLALEAKSRVPKKLPPKRFLGSIIAQRGAPNTHRGTFYSHKITPKVTHLRWVTFLAEKTASSNTRSLQNGAWRVKGRKKNTPEEVPGVYYCSTKRPKHSQGHSSLPQNPTKSDPSQMGHFSCRKNGFEPY